jgi:hypothetical protein
MLQRGARAVVAVSPGPSASPASDSSGVKWTDKASAIASIASASLSLLSLLVTVGVAIFGYEKFVVEARRERQKAIGAAEREREEARERRDAADAKVDVGVKATIHRHGGHDLVKVTVSVTNRCSAAIRLGDDPIEPTVWIASYPDEMLQLTDQRAWEHEFNIHDRLVAAIVFKGEVLDPATTVSDTVLLPIPHVAGVAAYRVEFILRAYDSQNRAWDWKAVDYVPVAMTQLDHASGRGGMRWQSVSS